MVRNLAEDQKCIFSPKSYKRTAMFSNDKRQGQSTIVNVTVNADSEVLLSFLCSTKLENKLFLSHLCSVDP